MRRKLLILTLFIATVVAALGLGAGSAAAATPPVARPGGPYTGVAGVPVQFDGSASTADSFASVAWNFGDGTGAFGLVVSHIYVVAGTFTVTLQIVDAAGQSSMVSTTATIAWPTPVILGPVVVGQTCVQTFAGLVCSVVPVFATPTCVQTLAGLICSVANVFGPRFCVPTAFGIACVPAVAAVSAPIITVPAGLTQCEVPVLRPSLPHPLCTRFMR